MRLIEQVLSLQSQIEILTKEQSRNEERNTRQQDENVQLQERFVYARLPWLPWLSLLPTLRAPLSALGPTLAILAHTQLLQAYL